MNKGVVVLCSLLMLAGVVFSHEKARMSVARVFGAQKFERQVLARCASIGQERKEQGFFGRHALVLQSSSAVNYIVLGGLNGQLDSFNRILNELIKKGVLSPALKVMQADTYIIINGPLGDSGQEFDMLNRLIDLMKANPQSVFVLRGAYEDREFWVNQGLGKRIYSLNSDSDELRTIMRNFFNTLTVGLYIYPSGEENRPLRIAWGHSEEDAGLACVLVQHKDPIKAICSLGDACSVSEPDLGAQIVSHGEGVDWEMMHGLERVGEPSIWHMLSNSSGHQQKSKSSYDAYVIVHVANRMEQSTIELFSRQSEGAFAPAGLFHLVSGKKAYQ